MAELEIRNLHVRAGEKEILKGLDLTVGKGEIHALMGPNGSGKSTLANVVMGHPNLEVTEGQVIFKGEDITEADTDERARMGLFMAFQYPVAVPGVTVTKYLRTVINAHRESRGEEPISLKDFRQTVEAAMRLTEVPREFSSRYLNEGFSGGEKKRMEILQLALQKPEMAILDETDSGLDIDALRVVSNGVNAVAGDHMGVLIITHYQRILHLVQPSHVHVMYQGRIVKEGGPELVDRAGGEGLRLDQGRGRGRVRGLGAPMSATAASSTFDAAAVAAQFPILQRQIDGGRARLPRLGRDRAEAGGRPARRWTSPTACTTRTSTAASTRSRRRRPSASRARASGSRASSARRRPRRSSRRTSPRRSTSSRTRGAGATSAPATRSC